jgi:hypothetical protein
LLGGDETETQRRLAQADLPATGGQGDPGRSLVGHKTRSSAIIPSLIVY